jgi:hypothetical protein
VRGQKPPADPPPPAAAEGTSSLTPAGDDDPGAAPLTAAETSAPLPVIFDRLRGFAQRENRSLFAALAGGRLLERTATQVRIALPEGFGARRLESRLGELEAVCARFFGVPLRVKLETEPQKAGVPAGPCAPDPEDARRRRQEALDHPGLHAALEILGGEIVEIRPLGGRP